MLASLYRACCVGRVIHLFGILSQKWGSKWPACEYRLLCNSMTYLDISGSDRVRFGYYFNDVINVIIFFDLVII